MDGQLFRGGSALTLALIAIIVVLVLVVWSIRRHPTPILSSNCGEPIEDNLASIAGLSLGTVVHGNTVEVFENGAFFDVLIAEIDGARHSVHFETFLWKEGALGQRLADAFCRQASAGRQVRVLLDANGSGKIGDSVERQLKD